MTEEKLPPVTIEITLSAVAAPKEIALAAMVAELLNHSYFNDISVAHKRAALQFVGETRGAQVAVRVAAEGGAVDGRVKTLVGEAIDASIARGGRGFRSL
ncbi:hypothetical protein [Rhizobium chutanense]|uniref:Uncharacterized protein n=1 Tax=Rhizobium chutanense TaxID=2035448 RepID=A0A432P402_9HYPH|nr:hypothetical protein [Rhizobium chutanense]RUM06803.1 hypothetical protein EFR84_11435 [Rhizobium chutanense]